MQNKYTEIPATDNRKIWTKLIGYDIETPDNNLIEEGYVQFLNEYNCNENTMIFYQSIYYDSEGKVIERYSVNFFEREVDEIVPDSVGDLLMQAACAL